MKSYKYWDRETRQAATILKRCEICFRLTRDRCRFCPDHKKEVDKHYENFKIAAFERAVNLTKLKYQGEMRLSRGKSRQGIDVVVELIKDDLAKQEEELKKKAKKNG